MHTLPSPPPNVAVLIWLNGALCRSLGGIGKGLPSALAPSDPLQWEEGPV